MAPSRQPGPWGLGPQESIDDGTMCRVPSAPPGPAGDAKDWLDQLHNPGQLPNALLSWRDGVQRVRYAEGARKVAEQILSDYAADLNKAESHLIYRVRAQEARNLLLDQTRAKLSPGGLAMSKAIKEEGKTLLQLEETYARRLLAARELAKNPQLGLQHGLKAVTPGAPGFDQNAFDTVAKKLGETEFNKPAYQNAVRQLQKTEDVTEAIIKGAGRTDRVVTAFAKFNKVAGPAGAVVQVVLSGYEIFTAEEGERLYVAGKELSGVTGGLVGAAAGGLAAGWVASVSCGPGAPVCGLVISIVIIGVASWAGAATAEKVYKAAPSLILSNYGVVGGVIDDGLKGAGRSVASSAVCGPLAAVCYFVSKQF
jgi:hypothetical protein